MLISARVGAASRELDAYVPRIAGRLPRGQSTVDGTAVFADVSGFTALTERLAASGREGAEELVGIIDELFTDLLDTAGELGGDLLKFGGDALLLFFDGASHRERAVAAAVRMQRRVRSVRTSAGRLRLQMSAGVHTGEFLFVVAGRTHTELVVLGPDVTEVLAVESAAEGGEVLLSASAGAGLPADLLGPSDSAGRRVLLAAPRRTPPPSMPLPAVDGGAWIAPALRDHLLRQPPAEHRLVAIIFAAVRGLDALVAAGHDLAPIVDGALRAAQDAMSAHEVSFLATDAGPDGFRMLGAVGAPVAFEDDAERALRAARDCVDAVTAVLSGEVWIGAGVQRGSAFAARVGSPARATYAVMGDVTNTAARLMARAKSGEVLTTNAVLAASRTRFRTVDLAPFEAKGKAQPLIPVLVLGAEEPDDGTPQGAVAALVGREAELQAIRSAGSTLVVSGDAGIGKTRLLQEAVPDAIRVVLDPYAPTQAYRASAELVRQLAPEGIAAAIATHARDLEPWAPLIALAAGERMPETPEVERLDEARRPAQLADATASLVAVLIRDRPILVEDAHWMDDSSAPVFEAIAERAATHNIRLVVTRRPQGGWCPKDSPLLDLPPLPASDVERLARDALPGRLLPDTVASITDRSGGNPLYVLELTRAIARSGEDPDLPDTLESLIASRIDALAPGAREVLRLASVAGLSFRRELVDASAGEPIPDRVWAELASLLRAQPDGTMRFEQALVQAAAYGGLTFRLRRAHHLRMGEILEQTPGTGADVLSQHFDAAGEARRAWRYAIEAADAARRDYGPATAAKLYERALRSRRVATRDEVADATRYLGDTLRACGRREDALDAYRAARKLARGSPQRRVDAMLREAHVLEDLGRIHDAAQVAAAAAAVRVTDAAGRRIHARVLIAQAIFDRRLGELRSSSRRARRALREATVTADRPGVAHALTQLHILSMGDNDPAGALYARQAAEIFELIGDRTQAANVLNNLGMDAHLHGRLDEAMDAYQRALRRHTEAGNVASAALVANNLGEVLHEVGRFDEAVGAFRGALETLEAINGDHIDYVRDNLAKAQAASG